MSQSALPRSAARDVGPSRDREGRRIGPFRRGLLAGLPLVIAAAGCTTTTGDAAAGGPDGVKVVIAADPASLDPAKVTTQADAVLARGLYDTLVRVAPSGEVVPGLASSWEQSLKTVSFKLRNGITCSDGSPLTPQAVAASINRLAGPDAKSPSASISFGGHKATAEADPNGMVTVRLDAPYSGLLVGLSMPWAGIICPAGLAPGASFADHSYGTGPYTLRSSLRGQRYVLARRDGHTWAPALGPTAGSAPSQVTVQVVENESTTANMLIRGDVHIAALIGPDVDRVRSTRGFQVAETSAGSSFVMFNEAAGHPGSDPATRKALAQAIDRQAFLRAANGGRGALTSSFVEPEVPCFAADTQALLPKPDPEAAGATGHKVTAPVRVIGTTQLAGGAGTTYVQAALQAAGFKTTLTNRDTTTWADMLYSGKGDWDLTVMVVQNIARTVAVPASLLSGSPPPAGTNLAAIDDPDFTAALRTAASTLGTRSCDALKEAQRALVKSIDILPLATLPLQVATAPGVRVQAPSGLIELGSIRTA